MGIKKKCSYCDELAVANSVEDGRRIPICAYHIIINKDQELPEMRSTDPEAPNSKKSMI